MVTVHPKIMVYPDKILNNSMIFDPIWVGIVTLACMSVTHGVTRCMIDRGGLFGFYILMDISEIVVGVLHSLG